MNSRCKGIKGKKNLQYVHDFVGRRLRLQNHRVQVTRIMVLFASDMIVQPHNYCIYRRMLVGHGGTIPHETTH